MTVYLTLLNAGWSSDYTVQSICHTLSATGWVKTASLVGPATWAAASQSPTGLMVTGGNSGSRLSTTQIFDGETFTLGTDIPVKTAAHCQVYTGTAVYIVGMCINCILYNQYLHNILFIIYIIFTILVLYII